MKILSILFLLSLAVGQAGGIHVQNDAVLYIHDIILALLLIEGFVQFAITSSFIKPRLSKPIFIFILAALFSLLTNSGKFSSNQLEVSALYLARWIYYSLVYILVLQIYTKTDVWLRWLYITGVAVAALGLVQFVLYPDLRNLAYLGWDPHFLRLFSTFLDPNFTGIFITLTILLGLYLFENKKIRIWILSGEILCALALLLTYSRSSYLAFVVSLTVYGILKKQLKILLGIIVFCSLIFVLPQKWGNNLSLIRMDSSFARIGNWKESIQLISRAPLFGYGFDTLRYVRVLPWGPFYSKAAAGLDSSVLFIGATTGFVGIAAYAYLIWFMIRKSRGPLLHVLIASLAAVGVHSLFVNSAFYPWVMIWVWVITGIAERLSGDT